MPNNTLIFFNSINSADHYIYYCIAHMKYLKSFQTNKNVFERTDCMDTIGHSVHWSQAVQHAKYSNEDITRQIILLSETYTHIQPATLSKYWFCHILAPAPQKNAFYKLNFFLRQTPIIVGNQYGAICKYFWYIL